MGPAGRADGALLGEPTACMKAVGVQVAGFGWELWGMLADGEARCSGVTVTDYNR